MKRNIVKSLGIFIVNMFSLLPLIAQTESKVAILTVSGSGKTQEEAKQNALRNAIEQAFGTFISSNTQILNDQLVKDEIVSVSNGNIQEYNIISEVQTPDGNWSNTLKAKVAIDKLTSFCENKGVAVEFKGALFTLNIKQQLLNEENEKKVIGNMSDVVKKIFDISFDYQVAAGEPKNYYLNDKLWEIPIKITIKTNQNLLKASDYIYLTLQGLSLSEAEIKNYQSLNKEFVGVAFAPAKDPSLNNSLTSNEAQKGKKTKNAVVVKDNSLQSKVFYLRSKESVDMISDLIIYLRKPMTSFCIYNDFEIKTGVSVCGQSNSEIKLEFNDQNGDYALIFAEAGRPGLFTSLDEFGCLYDKRLKKYFSTYGISSSVLTDPTNYYYKTFHGSFPNVGNIFQLDYLVTFQQFKIGEPFASISFKDIRSLDELSKISGYKIEPFKNNNLNSKQSASGTFTDPRDGINYKTVTIWKQTWFAENLIYLKNTISSFEDNTLEYAKDPLYFAAGFVGTDLQGARNSYKVRKNGVFYNWIAAKDACPDGWHLPTKDECFDLIEYVAMVDYINNNNGKALIDAGNHLKSINEWETEIPLKDEYNFGASPTGLIRQPFWENHNDKAVWWTNSVENEFYLSAYSNKDGNYFSEPNRYTNAITIRCIKN